MTMIKPKLSIFLFGVLLVATIFTSISCNTKSPGDKKSGTSFVNAEPSVAVNVFQNKKGAFWCYEIVVNSKRFIYQDCIPGISQRFASEADARKCGELVVAKMKKGKTPSISTKELDSLGVVYK
jgi:Domain of unknown function (DUF4907)